MIMPALYFAIPVMKEAQWLHSCFACIEKQTYRNFKVVVCVNQPENFRNLPDKKQVCDDNAVTLEYLKRYDRFPLTVIDRSSIGHGWKGKKHGVGWARKTVMDYISSVAAADDIIISMDADTVFNPDFGVSIIRQFAKYRKAVALALPYYHKLLGEEKIDRAMLHYEIYMRYYAINLWRIKNPYCFTAIGSSMALPVWAYRAVQGIAPKLSGEDFYFLQKLRKFGNIMVWNEEFTYPANRFSDRVFFGTGPALIKGVQDDWQSYPMYSYQLFDQVKATYDAFDTLFTEDMKTPMSSFLSETFPEGKIWQPLRDNFNTREKFVKACAEKIDGLRILQFLKSKQKVTENDAAFVSAYLKKFHEQELASLYIDINELNFENSPVEKLNTVRDLLTEIENFYRKKFIVIDWW